VVSDERWSMAHKRINREHAPIKARGYFEITGLPCQVWICSHLRKKTAGSPEFPVA
jgi:hypothetical protein